MFLGNLDQWEKDAQYVPAYIRPFIEMLAHVDFDTLETGRHELGNGNYMNVDESVTAPAGERKTECHSRYIDIQVLVDGSEYIGFYPTDGHRCLCAPDGKGAVVRKIIVKVKVQEEA